MKNTFVEVDQDRYYEMLEILPPAVMDGKGFLVGEPYTHRDCEVTGKFGPAFSAFIEHNGKFYEAERPMTVGEYKAFPAALVVG